VLSNYEGCRLDLGDLLFVCRLRRRVARSYFFETKNPNLSTFVRGLWIENVVLFFISLEYFKSIWYILGYIGIFYGHFVYIFPRFGILRQEKSGNPAPSSCANWRTENLQKKFRKDWRKSRDNGTKDFTKKLFPVSVLKVFFKPVFKPVLAGFLHN
jgi:hypothetical protein